MSWEGRREPTYLKLMAVRNELRSRRWDAKEGTYSEQADAWPPKTKKVDYAKRTEKLLAFLATKREVQPEQVAKYADALMIALRDATDEDTTPDVVSQREAAFRLLKAITALLDN